MKIMCIEVSSPIQDLKVKIHHSTLLFPIHETQRKNYFLSSIDQVLNFNVSNVFFFNAKPDFPPEVVVKMLKSAVEKVLVPYDFAAGRWRLNHLQLGRLEIDCNAAGAGFVVASSEFSLDEIGEFTYPNSIYGQLAAQSLDKLGPNNNDQPLLVFQLTSFKCGGFSLGFSTNHIIFDGVGAAIFLENLASQAFENKPLATIPCNDRHLLATRSPPRVAFSHPELLNLYLSPKSNASVFDSAQDELDSKIFKLSLNHINYLKNKAKSSIATGTRPIRITSFNVVAALIWRCKTLSALDVQNDDNKDKVSTLNYSVNIRSRLNPILPLSYSGNASVIAYSSIKCVEIEKWPFFEVVEKVYEGTLRMTDEYIRSTLDWIEINKAGLTPNINDYLIIPWWRLGIEHVAYPWGKPICSCAVRSHSKNVCMLLPTMDDVDGMNVLVSLPPKEMKIFQSLFFDFFGFEMA